MPNIGFRESETIEFKESTSLRKEAADDLVAMMNTDGGICYFGVKDDGSLLGLTKSQSTINTLIDRFGQRIDPRISPICEREVIDGTTILKVSVEKSKTPIHTSNNVPYKRVVDRSRQIDKHEYKQRLLQYDKPTYDFSQQTIEGASLNDIDPHALTILRKKLHNPRVNFDISDDDIQLLKSLHLIQDEKFTYASIILLGTTLATRKYIPFADISYGYRLSTGDSYNLDDFVGQGGYLLYADILWEKINNRNVRLNIPIGLGLDLNRMAFDEETIREGINNAVVHRDYYISSSIFIIQYPYTLDIISPGGLPEGVTIDNMIDESKPRNKLLADVLRRCNMVDEFGNGINKMIKNQLRRGKNGPNYQQSTKNKVYLHIDGAIADISFAKYMIALGEDKQLGLNDQQLTILRKIKAGEKVISNDMVQKLLSDGFIEKGGHGKYILCQQYYKDSNKRVEYSNKKRISKTDLIVLLNKYLGDHPDGLTKDDILKIPTISISYTRMTIYRILKKYQGIHVILEGKNRSPISKWKLIKNIPL